MRVRWGLAVGVWTRAASGGLPSFWKLFGGDPSSEGVPHLDFPAPWNQTLASAVQLWAEMVKTYYFPSGSVWGCDATYELHDSLLGSLVKPRVGVYLFWLLWRQEGRKKQLGHDDGLSSCSARQLGQDCGPQSQDLRHRVSQRGPGSTSGCKQIPPALGPSV